MRAILLLVISFMSLFGFAQDKTINIQVYATLGADTIHFDDSSIYAVEEHLYRISTLKFYLSNFNFIDKLQNNFAETNSFHLIDFSKIESQQFKIYIPEDFNLRELRCSLGIDSLTNVSGAMGGDLDPTRGMYWTWQSGYINFKLEGTCINCKEIEQPIELHLGGYQNENATWQNLSWESPSTNKLNLVLDLSSLLLQIDTEKTYRIMSPSSKAVQLSKIIGKSLELE